MMKIRTPVTLITGSLGSGKTTLIRHILEQSPKRLAIIMNEFGEIGIDGKLLKGENVHIAELDGGCVCCSMIGEFKAAVAEVIDRVDPAKIVVETTGVAEPDALIWDMEENMPQIRLDGVIVVTDADALLKFPRLGHTTRLQIEAADTILLNKIDCVPSGQRKTLEEKLRAINSGAPVIPCRRCRVDPDLLFGLGRDRTAPLSLHVHQSEFESVDYRTNRRLDPDCFGRFIDSIVASVYRAKGFVRFTTGESFLFNLVAGRRDMERYASPDTVLVFIGKGLRAGASGLLENLKRCER